MPMQPTTPLRATPLFADPRSRLDFEARYFPTVNGQSAPPITAAGRNEHIMLEVLAAYYDINRERQRLLDIQAQPVSPQRGAKQRECLQAIEVALIHRDKLEDHYASFGVIAEPLDAAGLTVNVTLSFGNVDAAGRLRSDELTLTAFVSIPLPEGVQMDGEQQNLAEPRPS